MTTIVIVFLFIAQIISFYLLALLYMKVSKFEDLEQKQNKLMKEMEDAIAVYLTEIKDENDKLVEKLTAKTKEEKKTEKELVRPIEQEIKKQTEESVPPIKIKMPKNSIRHQARQSYSAAKKSTLQEDVEKDDRTRAVQLYEDGKTIEEIAKKLKKGQTEVELILKFK